MDAISVQSLLNRDASKRKRVNRNAKIKQYKLDARREQWLSQGKQAISATGSPLILPVHGHKEVLHGGGDSDAESCVINHEDDPVDGLWCISNAVSKFISCSRQRGESPDFVQRPSAAAAAAAKQHQAAAIKSKKGKRRSKKVSPEQPELGDDEDWEAAADALGCQMNLNDHSSDSGVNKDDLDKSQSKAMNIAVQRQPSMAWKANDACRPASLPKLGIGNLQQLQLQEKKSSRVESESGPICCLICTEELDLTETSFIPCSCGFRLCLFCHHRISAEDGRCPGCRLAYRA